MEFFSSYKPAVYRCYGYGRVSRSDKEKTRRERDESNSITNQRDLIHDYIAQRPDLELCMEGYDDNYTGTNFDRPHFQEMMRAIDAGRIDCIVVKDDCVIKARTPQPLENRHFLRISAKFRAILRPQRTAHIIGNS